MGLSAALKTKKIRNVDAVPIVDDRCYESNKI